MGGHRLVQDEDSGKGLFVEHSGSDEATIRRAVERSLGALTATRGGASPFEGAVVG